MIIPIKLLLYSRQAHYKKAVPKEYLFQAPPLIMSFLILQPLLL